MWIPRAKLAASGLGQKPLFMNEAFETETGREETGTGHTMLPGPAEWDESLSGATGASSPVTGRDFWPSPPAP